MILSKTSLIEPRTLKGFHDYLPAAMIPREWLMDTCRRVYRSFGFCPIDTPALEYLDILTGKGSEETDKLMYRFQDHGGRDVGMRFDLTVPLARFVAQHAPALGTPFKRYHIGAVWRGENTQDGRYREFMQCDFDTIGTRSVVADIETALVIHELLVAIDIEQFTIHVNNRQVLSGLLEKFDLSAAQAPLLRALDKLDKVGREKVAEEMVHVAGATPAQANEILALAELSGSHDQMLAQLERLSSGSERGQTGVARLAAVVQAATAAGIPAGRLRIAPSIARGLDYYTGIIYETTLDALPSIGSVCSGGRYDDLAGLYTKLELPGIGASLGLDRLLTALEKLGKLTLVGTPAPVFIPLFEESHLHDYLRLAARMRAAGLGAEVFPESKKLGQQLKYADRRGFRLAVVVGASEFAAGTCQVKDLRAGTSSTLPLSADAAELIAEVRRLLAEDGVPASARPATGGDRATVTRQT